MLRNAYERLADVVEYNEVFFSYPENVILYGDILDKGTTLLDTNKTKVYLSMDGDIYLGLIGYRVDSVIDTAVEWSIVPYVQGSNTFTLDFVKVLRRVFKQNAASRVYIQLLEMHPLNQMLERIIETSGGHKVGILRRARRTADGKLKDLICYEILKEEFEPYEQQTFQC